MNSFVSTTARCLETIRDLIEKLIETIHKPLLYFERIRLESRFMDFLSILLVMDRCGLKIYDVFSEAIKGSLLLPPPYYELARAYHILSKTFPDPYTCLRKLAAVTPSPRLRSFLLSYSDILLSSGDTLKLIEYWIREEISVLKNRVEFFSKIIDSVYESYLVLVLGVAIYYTLPLTPAHPVLVSTILLLLSISAYMLVSKLLDATSIEMDPVTRYSTLAVVVITPLLVATPWKHIVTIHIALLVSTGVALRYLTEPFRTLEQEVFNTLEKIYSEVRLGQPIDLSFINTARETSTLKAFSNALSLGLKVSESVSLTRLKGFYRRVIDMLLAPIEYTRSGAEYIGYVLEIVENVSEFRRTLSERSKVYYAYVFFTLFVFLLIIYSLPLIGIAPLLHEYRLILRNLIYATLIECFTIASCFKKNYWYGSLSYYIAVVIVYATVLLL